MGIRIDRNKINALPKKLQEWAEDVEYKARMTDQSLHDALCDLQEGSDRLSEEECCRLMEAMDEYWDIY